jgi:hypothetical protein
MSNILSHAMRELDLIGMTEDSPDEMNQMMRKHILHMMQEFANEGHSGFSASYAINILTKLLDFKPLTPLTGADDEWNEISRSMGGNIRWQNNRRSSVFKDDNGEVYDIDGKVFWEWMPDLDENGPTGKAHKSYYTSRDSRVPVTFPYTVPDKPIYEYRQSDAEPKSPPQNEQGFL